MSGRKNNLLKFKILTAADLSQSTVTSLVSSVAFLDNIGFQINILSGSPSGTFSVEVSADYAQNEVGGAVVVLNAGTWVALNLSPSPIVTTGSPSAFYLDINQISAPWIRLKYTKSAGTGTCDAYITAKMI